MQWERPTGNWPPLETWRKGIVNRTSGHQIDYRKDGVVGSHILSSKKKPFLQLGEMIGATYGVIGPFIAGPLFFRAVAGLLGTVLQPILVMALVPLGHKAEWPYAVGMSHVDLLLLILFIPSLIPIGIFLMTALALGAIDPSGSIYESGPTMGAMLLGNLMVWIGIGACAHAWVVRPGQSRTSCWRGRPRPGLRAALAGATMLFVVAALLG